MGRKGYIVPVDPQWKGVDSSCSWIMLNSVGQCSIVKLNKYAIMRRFKIDARDLRLLDPHLSYPSTFLARDMSILLNFELREYIDDTEDYINIQIDNLRNQLIQLELFLSSGTLCLAIFSLVTAIFGVNIKYKWNQGYGYMFKWVVIVSGLVNAFLFLVIISYARYKGLVGS